MNLPMFDLSGRTAIVTGGGRGIGKGICLALAQAGANIVVANRDTATAAETVREVEALGRKSIAIQTDVCQSTQVENLVNKTVEVFGTLDILVNNAGGTTREMRVPPLQVTEQIWDDAIDLNLKSIYAPPKQEQLAPALVRNVPPGAVTALVNARVPVSMLTVAVFSNGTSI